MYIQPQWLSDKAVIQRNQQLVIRGVGPVKASVSLELNREPVAQTISDAQGNWVLTLPAHKEAEGNELSIIACQTSGESDADELERVDITDLAFGDVWLMGGQSNMEFETSKVTELYGSEFDQAHDSGVRFLRIPITEKFDGPAQELPAARWHKEGTDSIADDSAVAYFFAQKLRAENPEVPIGLIDTAVGGSPVEAWIDEQRLEKMGFYPPAMHMYKQPGYAQATHKVWEAGFHAWQEACDSYDEGLHQGWKSQDYDDSSWQTMSLEQANMHNPQFATPGVVWLRTHIEVAPEAVGKEAVLHLGTPIEADETYVNGTKIGTTEFRWPRRYYHIDALPAQLSIAIRLIITGNRGGFIEGKKRELTAFLDGPATNQLADGQHSLSLCDLTQCEWKVKRGVSMPEAPGQFLLYNVPSACYNAMMAPLAGTKVAGIVYYQGESNADKPENYAAKMGLLIQCWRELFNCGPVPFVEIQLPNWGCEAAG